MAISALIMANLLAAPKVPELVNDVSRRAAQYFWDKSHPVTGLTLDRAPNSDDVSYDPKEKDKYTVASQAATGYGLCAYAIGAERGWFPRAEAEKRTLRTLKYLNNGALKDHGWFYHFIDWSDGSRVWNSEVSTIDTALLLSGVLMVESTFKSQSVKAEAQKLIKNIDWLWMLHDGGQLTRELTFTMGWGPEHGFINGRWNHMWENPFLNIYALGAEPKVPTATWEAFRREILTYKGRNFITGGPLFIAEMPQHFLDMKGKRDSLGFDYWISARNFVLATRQYCIDNPKKFKGYGPDMWGLNACDSPDGYGAWAGFGPGEDNGTLMPSAALGAIMFTPELAIRSAETCRRLYPKAYGKYGFANAIHPTKNWIDPDVIGIDLGMVMLSIENYRDGLPHRLLERSPIVQIGMKRAGFHKTSEGPLESRKLQILHKVVQ